jgi:hypothetical protein
MTKRFPTKLEQRAVELGADNLIAMAEWLFRFQPRKLKILRDGHRAYCSSVLRKIERAGK